MSVYSNRRHLLRKNLNKKVPVFDLSSDDLDEEAELVFGRTEMVANKRPKNNKRDEWADIVDLAEGNSALEIQPPSVVDSAPKKGDEILIIKSSHTSEQKVERKPCLLTPDDDATLALSSSIVADDEQLYKELFGELDLSNVKASKIPTQPPMATTIRTRSKGKSNLKQSRQSTKGPVTTQDMLARLDALEQNYKTQNGHANRIESVDSDVEALPSSNTDSCLLNEKIQVKFKYLTSVHRLWMQTDEKFLDRLPEIGQLLAINDPHKLRFFLNTEMFTADQTPKSLQLTVGNIIECIQLDNRTSGGSSVQNVMEDVNLIVIKLRDAKAHKRSQITTMKIDKFEPMGKMFAIYAQQKELQLDKIRFEFDGEELEAEQTPTDLDMEEDSLIDVIVKSN